MQVDWSGLLTPSTSLLEVMLRGTVMYVLLLVGLRILNRRHVGSMSLTDLLLMVLIADAAQNAMANNYRSVTEGAVLCGTLMAWNFFFDWVAYRCAWFRRLVEPDPLPIVKDGVLLRKNLRTELITVDEVLSHLREQGIEDLSLVKIAHVEPDGGISVVRRDAAAPARSPDQRDNRAIT